jgi:hypothetical protein
MADDELDELYRADPAGFTGLRSKLAEGAKRRGDTAAAKRISSARKPTTAAWVVNRLVLGDQHAKQRLGDLGERLRAAHAAMDGERIRELSAEQRRLIDGLARAAFGAAGVTDPTAVLRDDVADTLQAAIADPEVAARLGRLTKAERWSGFGEFGDTAPVSSSRSGRSKGVVGSERAAGSEGAAGSERAADRARDLAREQRQKTRAALVAAESARAEADEALVDRQAELASARLRRDQARRNLREAERGLEAAEEAYEQAKQASHNAAGLVKEAKAQLR